MQLTDGVPRASRRFAPERFLVPGHALLYARPAGLDPWPFWHTGALPGRDWAEDVKSFADEFWPGRFRFAAKGADQCFPSPAKVLTMVAMTEILSTRFATVLRSVPDDGQGLNLDGAQKRNRTADTRIFSPLLYRLSYLGQERVFKRGLAQKSRPTRAYRETDGPYHSDSQQYARPGPAVIQPAAG